MFTYKADIPASAGEIAFSSVVLGANGSQISDRSLKILRFFWMRENAKRPIRRWEEKVAEIHTGSCLCGAVRFKTSGTLRGVVYCHCSQCRKQSGHYYAATNVADTDLEVTG